MQFTTLEQLYNYIKPALAAKQSEMRRNGYDYVTNEDIWNYLKEIKWKRTNNLEIYEMVNDILNVDDLQIDLYLKQKLGNRKLYFEEA